MTVHTLLEAYRQVARAHDLPPMEAGTTSVVRRGTVEPAPPEGTGEDAWAFVTALDPRAGWVQFQSRVVAFTNGNLPAPAPDWGCLLAAEALLSDERTLVVGPDGRGSLQAVVLTAGAVAGDTDVMAPAGPVLVDRVRHRATSAVPGPHPTLRYRRYWALDPERGIVPVVAAFCGFAAPEE